MCYPHSSSRASGNCYATSTLFHVPWPRQARNSYPNPICLPLIHTNLQRTSATSTSIQRPFSKKPMKVRKYSAQCWYELLYRQCITHCGYLDLYHSNGSKVEARLTAPAWGIGHLKSPAYPHGRTFGQPIQIPLAMVQQSLPPACGRYPLDN